MTRDRSDDREAAAALAAGRPAFVWRRQIADTDTPVSAGLALMEEGRGDFLLESVEGGQTRGRHSLIGLAPDLIFRAEGDAAEINGLPVEGGAIAALRSLVEQCRAEVPPELPRALACLVGYMGFETAGLVEALPPAKADPIGVPDMIFMRPTLLLVFDRLKDELFIVAPVFPSAIDADDALAAAQDRIETAASRLSQPVPFTPGHAADPEDAVGADPRAGVGLVEDRQREGQRQRVLPVVDRA